MAVTYLLRFDDSYGVESLKRHRAIVMSRWARWPLKILCALGMTALAALGLTIKSYVVFGTAIGFLALLLFAPQLDYLIVRRRYRKHAQYGSDVNVELSEDGLKVASRDSDSNLRWSSFTSAAGFEDGLILYLAPWHYVWLPDSGVQSGDPAQARTISGARVAKYHGV
jgi:hypothetical protein